ncbi:MAG: amidohydrolase [Cyclobacteriaceae bacterium]
MRIISILMAVLLAACSAKNSADLILKGGPIYTNNPEKPTVEAVVVSGDTIMFAGTISEALTYQGKQTKVIDLKGKMMTPGLIEGHGHIMGLGYNEMNLDLMGIKNFDAIVEEVRKKVSASKPGEWIVGRGWHQDKWDSRPSKMIKGFPTHDLITAAAPDNPVVLKHASGHNILVNLKAMQMAGINATATEKIDVPVGGEIIRDELGNPTGLFNETAAQLITDVMPAPSEESDRKALELAIAACHRNGITSFQSAGEDQKVIDLIEKLKRENLLGVRMYVMLSGTDRELVNQYFKSGPLIDKWLTIRSIKLYGDGALGSRGAWLLEPYSDRANHYGQPNMIMDSVYSVSKRALQSGLQVCTHAIGDRANREVLNQYEKAFNDNPSAAKNARFRIEHAQHLHPDDIGRFAKLGVLPAMQAIHLSSDRPWAIDRLGQQRIIDGAYVWKKLIDSGATIINGSDVPVEPINPIASFYASVTRKTLKGEPENGYESEQVMTREQALRSYTIDAAYGAFEEKLKGSIQVGKLADFTVFSKDLMTISENEILTTEVVMTIVGGKVFFEKK